LLIPEIITLTIFQHDAAGWRFRFGSGLLIRRWIVAVAIFSVIVILFFTADYLSKIIEDRLKDFEYRELLAPAALLVTFVWIWHFIVGMNFNRRMVILLLIAGGLIGTFIWINFG